MPRGETAGPPPGYPGQPCLLQHFVYPAGRQALGVGQPQQVTPGRPARLQGRRVQQRAEHRQRAAEAGIRLATDKCLALIGCVQGQDHPHCGGLPGPVRADEAGDLTGRDSEGHPVQRHRGPEPLAQPFDFDGYVVHPLITLY